MEVNIPEHIKRKMKGSRRYKQENRETVKPRGRFFGPSIKPNWWTRLKKKILNIIGRVK